MAKKKKADAEAATPANTKMVKVPISVWVALKRAALDATMEAGHEVTMQDVLKEWAGVE